MEKKKYTAIEWTGAVLTLTGLIGGNIAFLYAIGYIVNGLFFK